MIRYLFGVLTFLVCTNFVFAENCTHIIIKSKLQNNSFFYWDSGYYNERGNEWTNKLYWHGNTLDSIVHASMQDGVLSQKSSKYYTTADDISGSGLEYIFSFVKTDSSVVNFKASYSNGNLTSSDSMLLYGDSLLIEKESDADGFSYNSTFWLENDTVFQESSFSGGSVSKEYVVSINDDLCLGYDENGDLADSIKIIYQTDGFILQYIEDSYYREFQYLYLLSESAIPERKRFGKIGVASHKYDLLGRKKF